MDNETACRMMFQSVDETSGHITVEIETDGKPVLAADFAKLITDTVRSLNAVGEAIDEKSIKWAIIEANIIGNVASFTLKGYDKELFVTRKRRKKSESTP